MNNNGSSLAVRTATFRRRKFVFILPCFALFTVLLAFLQSSNVETKEGRNDATGGRHLLQSTAINESIIHVPCIEASIYSFPKDFFTQEERMMGGVAVHFIILIYMCAMLAMVCDEYFVPSLDIICERLSLPSDVAGATFMAIGTSSPELYSAIIGSFITEGDIGIGTIVGSAVFNLLCVTGLAGIAVWSEDVPVEWYPVSRDGAVYAVTIAALTAIISNNIVTWWEALILLTMFAMYIIIMYYNTVIEKFCQKQAKKFRNYWFRNSKKEKECACANEKTPLLSEQTYTPEIKSPPLVEPLISKDSYSIEIHNTEQKKSQNGEPEFASEDGDNEVDTSLWSPPSSGIWHILWWILMWPASLVFFITIPDVRKDNCRKCFILTFLSSTLWLGALSYICVWMVTIIGYTFYIPDTVSGLTLLAAGTSLPEVLSSIIVVRNGLGNMVMSNLIGSNIFDILFCLGAPWFIKTLASGDGYLIINSSAMTYTTTTLLVTIVGLFIIFNLSSWKLNKNMGFACLLTYVVFVVLACLYELNVLGDFNPPMCPR